jgi:hypothetical protein
MIAKQMKKMMVQKMKAMKVVTAPALPKSKVLPVKADKIDKAFPDSKFTSKRKGK